MEEGPEGLLRFAPLTGARHRSSAREAKSMGRAGMTANNSHNKWIGKRTIRPDGEDKVTGRATFGADFTQPGMLVGKVLRSPHPHARIISINLTKAAALPGVKAVMTGQDLVEFPWDKPAILGIQDLRFISRNVMARDKVLYAGHAVAAVLAGDGEQVEVRRVVAVTHDGEAGEGEATARGEHHAVGMAYVPAYARGGPRRRQPVLDELARHRRQQRGVGDAGGLEAVRVHAQWVLRRACGRLSVRPRPARADR